MFEIVVIASIYLALIVVVGYQIAFNGVYPSEKPDIARLNDYQVEEFEFEGCGGVSLHGWFIQSCNNPSNRTLLILHGLFRSRAGIVRQMKLFSDAGFHVISYDQRSHGTSDRGLLTFGDREGCDAMRALDHLRQDVRINFGKLGAVGFSLGSSAVIHCAANVGATTFRAILLEGVYARSFDVGEKILRDAGGYLFSRIVGYLVFAPGVFLWSFGRWKHSETISSIAKIEHCPILIIRGDSDAWASDASARSVTSSTINARVWHHTGGHIDAARIFPDEYRQRVLSFFNEHIPHG